MMISKENWSSLISARIVLITDRHSQLEKIDFNSETFLGSHLILSSLLNNDL